jgi:hypothetical protein
MIKKIINNTICFLIIGFIYSYALYGVVDYLAMYSPLVAFMGNLLFIFFMIAADEFGMRRYWRADAIYARLAKIKNKRQREFALYFERWSLKNYVSFRTFLFVFYFAVLIAAQISKFYPDLIEDSVANFLSVIEYSVIVLLALKDIVEEFPRDRSRAQTKLEEFELYLAEQLDIKNT